MAIREGDGGWEEGAMREGMAMAYLHAGESAVPPGQTHDSFTRQHTPMYQASPLRPSPNGRHIAGLALCGRAWGGGK